MKRTLAWLARPLWGCPRWRWLACVVLAAIAAYVFADALAAAWGLLALVPLPRRDPMPPDPAPIGIRVSDQAEARDRELAGQQREAEEAAQRARIEAARTSLDDAIRELNERRARRGQP